MNIEESYSHRDYHRDKHYPQEKSCNKEEGAAELAEDGYHQGHVAAETENVRKSLRQFVKVHKFINSVHEEQDTEDDTDGKNED